VYESSLLILNQIDLLPYVPFDLPLFRDDVRRLKPGARLVELSAATGAGVEQWDDWLIQVMQQKLTPSHA
jgi:hydrogenase nickel incorporation protein HypB